MGKEFYVDTDKLKKVTQDISNLLESLQDSDATPGTPSHFQEHASSIGQPTATFWDGDTNNALANTYSEEFKYVNATYSKLQEQLGVVLQACQGTVSQYDTHEAQAKHDVTSSHPEM